MTTDYLLLIFFTSCLSATDPIHLVFHAGCPLGRVVERLEDVSDLLGMRRRAADRGHGGDDCQDRRMDRRRAAEAKVTSLFESLG